MKVDRPPTVRPFHERTHLSAVAELEAAASADRTRIYSGLRMDEGDTCWTAGGIREFLRGGRCLVALNANGAVVGFAVFFVTDTSIRVPKLVAPLRTTEDVLIASLWETLHILRRQFLELPLILDIG